MRRDPNKNAKKGSNRDSIAALNKQQVSPSRSVAPHYRDSLHNDSVTLV
jgi:hypothetical protein